MNQMAQRQFDGLVQQMQASTLVQAGGLSDTADLLKPSAKQAVQEMAVSARRARTPGFFKPDEAAQIMAYASGRGKELPPAFQWVSERASVLSTVSDGGVKPGGRLTLKFAVPSGQEALDEPGRAKMVTVSRMLNRSVNDYREAYKAYSAAPSNVNEKESIGLMVAEDDVLRDSEVFLLARNELATAGFDVSSFDKNADNASLLVLAVRRHELNREREPELKAQLSSPTSGMGM